MNYLGIDNGVSGALAFVGECGSLIDWIPMPTKRRGKRGSIEVDVKGIAEWLWQQSIYCGNTKIIIEAPGGAKSYKAAVSMAGSFHALRALFEVKGFEIHFTTPQRWQRELLKCAAGDTKPAALRLARKLWPDEKWLKTPRCKTAFDGAVDAALIAEYARRNKL